VLTPSARRVLGIDLGAPGALVVLTPGGDFGAVLHWQRLRRGLDLAGLRAAIGHLVSVYAIELVATERPFIGGYARTTASQREKFSVVKTLCQERSVKLVSYGPSEIKKALTGNGRASKEQVKRAVRSLLRFEAVDEHVADAAAIGAVAMSREGRR
jgi:crossover junction endodeoxyribonuclease RuvC